MHRYRLTFYGSDTTDIAAFFCFDDIGRQVVQAPCTALINRQRTSPGFPKELMALVSKIFTFSVHVTDDTCRSKDLKKYRVDRIVERSDRRGSPLATNLPLSTILHLQQTPPKLPITSAATTAQETIALVHSDTTIYHIHWIMSYTFHNLCNCKLTLLFTYRVHQSYKANKKHRQKIQLLRKFSNLINSYYFW